MHRQYVPDGGEVVEDGPAVDRPAVEQEVRVERVDGDVATATTGGRRVVPPVAVGVAHLGEGGEGEVVEGQAQLGPVDDGVDQVVQEGRDDGQGRVGGAEVVAGGGPAVLGGRLKGGRQAGRVGGGSGGGSIRNSGGTCKDTDYGATDSDGFTCA